MIIAVLAAAAIPLAENAIKREREIELRRNLRQLRTAIDEYWKFVKENSIQVEEDTYGYPAKLEDLVAGIEYKDKNGKERIRKFLRAIPFDPITRSYEWGLRSYQDNRDSNKWGGQNVWDVYCDSEAKSLEGTIYRQW